MPEQEAPGLHLTRTDENVSEIAALADLLGGPVGLDAVLDDLNRRARRSWGWFGRAVQRAYTWDAEDRRTTDWWPQGITTSADAADTEEIGGRRVLAMTWYAKEVAGVHQGSRVTFLDLDTLRYRHVLLVVPRLRDGALELAPLRVHAGGVVWRGPYLHVAATARGFVTCRLDDLLRIPDDRALGVPSLGVEGDAVGSFGYRYVLPVRFAYQPVTSESLPELRYSFLSLDRGSVPPALVAGEYGARKDQTTRLARFPLDAATGLLETGTDGLVRPLELAEGGVRRMQGAAVVGGTWHVTVSNGPWGPGSVFVGRPGELRELRFATPMGCEDITFWPSTDTFWSLSEHPRRRWVFAMPRSRLG